MLTASILTFLNPEKVGFEPLIPVRCAWNALFGVIMILLQPKWASYGGSCTTWVHTRFGFLTSWFGKAMFFLFVGTNKRREQRQCRYTTSTLLSSISIREGYVDSESVFALPLRD